MALGLILAGGAILGSSALGGMGSSAAAGAQRKMSKEELATIAAYSQAAMQNAAPYMRLGKQAADAYAAALPGLTNKKQYKEFTDPYTMEKYKESPLYTPMVTNLAELQATPGYQFQLQQGQQAANMGAAARGGMLSGAQQQALQRFGQGLASTGFENAWQRAQNAYKSAFEANQARGRMLMGANQQAANIYSNATGIGNQAQQAFGQLGKGLLDSSLGIQQQVAQANAVQAAAPYQAASSALSGLGNLAMMGAGRGLFDSGPGANTPNLAEWSGSSGRQALNPGFQSLGGTPTSSQSIWSTGFDPYGSFA